MSAVLSCLEKLPASCQLGLEGRLTRLNKKAAKCEVVTDKKVESSWVENTLFGDLNQARGLYTNGFNRSYDIYAIPNLVGAALFSIATIPAQLLRTIWSVCCLVKAILPEHRTGACDPLLENLSGLAQATMMATIATALAVFKLATFLFRDSYEFCFKNAAPKRVLLIIDVQKDFEAGGSLAVPKGDDVVPHINAFIQKIKKDPKWADWRIVLSQDWHPFDHKSFAGHSDVAGYSKGTLNGIGQMFWSAHCVQGSKGAEFDPRLNLEGIPSDRLLVVKKGFNKHIDSYSAWQDNRNEEDTTVRDDTVLDENLKHWNTTEVVVVGLATDFCVKYSALDAQARKYKVTVIKDGCRGIACDPSESGICGPAFDGMQTKGITVVDSVENYFIG